MSDWQRASEIMDEKPPLGVKPRHIHDQARALNICEAMSRYVAVHKKIPVEWFSELADLCGEK